MYSLLSFIDPKVSLRCGLTDLPT